MLSRRVQVLIATDSWGNDFWINCILTLLAWIPGWLHALFVVARASDEVVARGHPLYPPYPPSPPLYAPPVAQGYTEPPIQQGYEALPSSTAAPSAPRPSASEAGKTYPPV